MAHAFDLLQRSTRQYPALDWKINRDLPAGYARLDNQRLEQATDFILGVSRTSGLGAQPYGTLQTSGGEYLQPHP
ncbi:hypothetical protein GPB2148_33 [marine gamma proteobacterium HTCC2148]|nr:hypothetical protein GPB2148_33 [marine gamma proteobacterium HTCC2148]